jgi:putative RNA 2'-phosphotransferase
MNDIDLSKTISFFLRHRPDKAGLALGEGGFIPTEALIAALRREPRFASVALSDIERVVRNSDKQRFEIAGERIRARYGHSMKETVAYDPVEPPERLYHGTSPRAIPAIREEGLLPMDRQYVHLSVDPQQALVVGKRHSKRDAPVLLQAQAKDAWKAGVKFYRPEPRIFLSDPIPPRYLVFEADDTA